MAGDFCLFLRLDWHIIIKIIYLQIISMDKDAYMWTGP